jgi:OmpA-OmpF porin, OOP family
MLHVVEQAWAKNQLCQHGGFMSHTLLSSLSSVLKPSTREEIAKALGESEASVSRGLDSATASIFDGLRRQTAQPEAMRQLADLASKAPADPGFSINAGQLSNPNSPLIQGGKRFLSFLFGAGQDTVLNDVSRDSGLRATSSGTVLAVAAQAVLSYIGTRVRNEGMTPSVLTEFLRSEGAGPLDAAPAVAGDAYMASASVPGPVTTRRIEVDPVIAQTVEKQRSFWLWLLPLLLILLGLLLWSLFRSRPGNVAETPSVAPVPAETAAPAVPLTPDLGPLAPRTLVDGTVLNIPERGVEGRLLAFIQDPSLKPDKSTWFDFDRLLFSTGSATLQPQSIEQLHNIAAILKAYPQTHLTIGGYTDNTGDAAANLKLSQDRADNVTAELIRLGVSSDRLTAKGYGDEHPVADNSTEAGRAQNRRISMLVTQK